jgi:hypothetical protein
MSSAPSSMSASSVVLLRYGAEQRSASRAGVIEKWPGPQSSRFRLAGVAKGKHCDTQQVIIGSALALASPEVCGTPHLRMPARGDEGVAYRTVRRTVR